MEPRCRSFSRNSEKALADAQLQTALSRATARFLEKRTAAIAGFPQFEETRELASRIKSAALDRLDELLARFIEEASSRGAVVHVARDGAEAREIGARIAAEERVKVAVKSKSMAAEEVGFNAALEDAGVDVVESDLGEFIIQLAGEPPSHIIAPAIHKTREQVSRLFHEKLGEPYTEEIPALTQIARRRADADADGVGLGDPCVASGVPVGQVGGFLDDLFPGIHSSWSDLSKALLPTDDRHRSVIHWPRPGPPDGVNRRLQFLRTRFAARQRASRSVGGRGSHFPRHPVCRCGRT